MLKVPGKHGMQLSEAVPATEGGRKVPLGQGAGTPVPAGQVWPGVHDPLQLWSARSVVPP